MQNYPEGKNKDVKCGILRFKFQSSLICVYTVYSDQSVRVFNGKYCIFEQMRMTFGVDHIYNADSFNEMTPKSRYTAVYNIPHFNMDLDMARPC